MSARGAIENNGHICWANKKEAAIARPEKLHRLRAATSEGAVPKLIKDREQRSLSTESKSIKNIEH